MSPEDKRSRELDDALDKTFPASDPIAISEGTGTEPARSRIDRQTPLLPHETIGTDRVERKAPEHYAPGTAEPLRPENKFALLGIAALAGCLLIALSSMMGDNGTHNDASNRGPSGQAQNRADPPPSPTPQAR